MRFTDDSERRAANIQITRVTLPSPTLRAKPYLITDWWPDRVLHIDIDHTLTKPRVRVRAPTERITIDKYALSDLHRALARKAMAEPRDSK